MFIASESYNGDFTLSYGLSLQIVFSTSSNPINHNSFIR